MSAGPTPAAAPAGDEAQDSRTPGVTNGGFVTGDVLGAVVEATFTGALVVLTLV